MRRFSTLFNGSIARSSYKPVWLVSAILCMGAIQLSAQSGIVFRDYNDNGTKDAGEPGVSGVLIKSYINGSPDVSLGSATSGTTEAYTLSPELFKAGLQIGATTTASNDTYYFNNSNVNLNGPTGLLPEMAYVIRVNAADFPAGKFLS